MPTDEKLKEITQAIVPGNKPEEWPDDSEVSGGNLFEFRAKGDTLTGEIHSQDSIKAASGNVVPRYVIIDDNGEPWTILTGAILTHKLSNAVIGDRVKIVYQGEQNLGQGRKLKDFRVWLKRTGRRR